MRPVIAVRFGPADFEQAREILSSHDLLVGPTK